MAFNILEAVTGQLGSELANQASKFLGESGGGVTSALGSALPALLGSLTHQASASPSGAAKIFQMLTGPGVDTGMLGNLAGLFGGGDKTSGLMSAGQSMLSGLLGDKVGGLAINHAQIAVQLARGNIHTRRVGGVKVSVGRAKGIDGVEVNKALMRRADVAVK